MSKVVPVEKLREAMAEMDKKSKNLMFNGKYMISVDEVFSILDDLIEECSNGKQEDRS
jgi:hypothetical protein